MASKTNHTPNCKCWRCKYSGPFKRSKKFTESESEMTLLAQDTAKNEQPSSEVKNNEMPTSFPFRTYSLKETELNRIKSSLVHGQIKIQNSNGLIMNENGHLYLKFKPQIDPAYKMTHELKNVPKFMATVWGMKSPQIIISIVTGTSNFRNWKNRKLEQSFRRGLMKAANKTEMWIITNGINGGLSAMIGEAFNEEMMCRSTAHYETEKYSLKQSLPDKPLTLIGVVSAKQLMNASSFDGVSKILTSSGNQTTGKFFKFDSNPDHTHLIIYDDTNEENQMDYDQFRNKMELLLTLPLGYYRRKVFNATSDQSDDDNELNQSQLEKRHIPIVSLMLRGDLTSINVIESNIRNNIPVVILKGTGAAADIISFAYEEMTENKDQDHEDNFVKPEILKKLAVEFADDLANNDFVRNQYRDKILSIVKNGIQGTQYFITIIDVKGMDFSYSDLDQYILTALLQSQPDLVGRMGKVQTERNIRLTLDWNCPQLALTDIFQRNDYTQIEIKNNLFEKAICTQNREEFVQLFLDQGFSIHRFLGRNNIRDLFTKTEENEFFVTVIIQSIMGYSTSELPENFLPDGLNSVLKHLTSVDNMVNILEIYMNQLGFYVTDSLQAEKKALNFLIIYAVIFNRPKLAKILWKRSDNPLALALLCSLIYKNMLKYVKENYLKTNMVKTQKEFADAAIHVLSVSFDENDPRAISILQYKHTEWNDLTLLELAYNGENKDFIAHPACQKILKKRLFGSIQIRDVDTSVPASLKILLSALLVFPMYRWILFPWTKKRLVTKNKFRKMFQGKRRESIVDMRKQDDPMSDSEEDSDEYQDEVTKKELNMKLMNEMKKNRKTSQFLVNYMTVNRIEDLLSSDDLDKLKNVNKKEDKIPKAPVYEFVSPSLHKKIYMLWSSPFTKFWMNFISYMCFLFLFSVVTLWPACGNLILDSLLWLWTASIAIEETRVTYKSYLTGSQLPLKTKFMEISTMILFLVLFFLVRIVGSWDGHLFFGFDKILASKMLLCFFLLYFFYRTVFIFLPMSSVLGPMLISMKLMVSKDFMTYLRLLIIFTTACGIALNSSLYPFYPINYEFLKKTFMLRGVFQIFMLDKDELDTPSQTCTESGLSNHIDRPYQCFDLTQGMDFSYSYSKLKDYGVNYKCVQPSLFSWLILIQYFFLIKLFLPNLLTALFANTILKTELSTLQIWMFQRYEIVIEYENRLPFGPPLTIICYLFMSIRKAWFNLKHLCNTCRICCSCFCFKHYKENTDEGSETTNQTAAPDGLAPPGQSLCGSTNAYNYWRNIAQNYQNNLEKDLTDHSKFKKFDTVLSKIRTDLISQRQSMQRLNFRVINLEQSIQSNQQYLEHIKSSMSSKVSKKGLYDRRLASYIHILARESPYVNTNITRFFIYEKLVPWECTIELYDPPFCSFPADSFKVEKIFIDEDEQDDLASLLSEKNVKVGTPNLSSSRLMSYSQSSIKSQLQNNARSRLNSSRTEMPKHDQYMWNCSVTIEDPRPPFQVGKMINVDRTSWIEKINEANEKLYPFIYSLDGVGYPRNPIGRTGIRGRGALMRYGPNKEIMAIATRWRKTNNNRPIYVEGRKLLEFINARDNLTGASIIPGDKILGDESKYSVVCRTFMEIVFEDKEIEKGFNFTEDDMTKFFCSFASQTLINYKNDSNENQSYNAVFQEYGFKPTMIYRGYIDDPRNTDNAWVEAEIWNFHYDEHDYFNEKIKHPESKWREVSSNVRIVSNEIISDALKEIAEMHNAFYS